MNRCAKSVAVFDSHETLPKLKYFYDIKDTHGQPHTYPVLWKLTDELTPFLLENLIERHNLTDAANVDDILNGVIQKAIDENIEGFSWNNWHINLLTESVRFVTYTRLGLVTPDTDFNSIVNYANKEYLYRLGINVQCAVFFVLIEIERD